MESEYIAMSMALCLAIPLLAVIESVTDRLHYHKHKLLTFKETIYEDNQVALILTNLETGRCTPRSKFYAIKLYWFQLWLKPKEIEVKFVPTLLQKAGYLTKPLPPIPFQQNWFLSMGW